MKLIGLIFVVLGFSLLLGPVTLGLVGGAIGLAGGLFGLAVGLVAGVFGAVVGIIGGLFGALFGLGIAFVALALPVLIVVGLVVGLVKLISPA